MFDTTQMYKGLLEGCILAIIRENSTYGYDIVTRLGAYGFNDVKEGTIYPLLMRLEKKGIVTSEYRPSALGPSRKYYTLTEVGADYLGDFIAAWNKTSNAVNALLGGEKHG